MYRSETRDLGESCRGRRKELIVFLDTEEGSFCDCCRRMVRVRMVSMSGCGGEYGGPEVCETCLAEALAALVAGPAPANGVEVVAVDAEGTAMRLETALRIKDDDDDA